MHDLVFCIQLVHLYVYIEKCYNLFIQLYLFVLFLHLELVYPIIQSWNQMAHSEFVLRFTIPSTKAS